MTDSDFEPSDQKPSYDKLILERILTDPWYMRITQLLSTAVTTTNRFYQANNIAPVLVPITTGVATSPAGLGSDSKPVMVELFGERTYLADSMQFYLEAVLRHGSRGVYYIMPTFRGEQHDASHLNQFFHSEAEIVGDLDDVINLAEQYVLALARGVLEGPWIQDESSDKDRWAHVRRLEGRSFPRITYAEALRELRSEPQSTMHPSGQRVITRRGEEQLVEWLGDGVWLTHPPAMLAPFYQRTRLDGTAEAADLILQYAGEVLGCGARHETAREVRKALRDHHVDPQSYAWYVRMKELIPLQTAGFGLGLERWLQWVLRHEDIRDMQVIPRLAGVPSIL
jgi:asparaginyl-tRNA synthetase